MSNPVGDRDALHALIDKLRPEDLGTAQRVLQAFNASDAPLLTALHNAPADDEAESDAERAASERACREIEEGKTLSHDEMKRKLRRV